jgi:transposase
VIAALDSDGQIYLSLVQANTNTKIMEIFLQQLARKLDSESDSWRSQTVWLWDNAPWHANSSMLKFLERMEVQVLYTAPHSFAASPIELLFSAMKATDINPDKLKTGKQ